MPQGERLSRLFTSMQDRRADQAIAEGTASYTYGDLLDAVERAGDLLDEHRVRHGDVIGLQSDFSFAAIALAFALFQRNCVVVFLSRRTDARRALADCHAAGLFRFSSDGKATFDQLDGGAHPLLSQLRDRAHPGFVVLSSGSSGAPKAILHDLEAFFGAYERPLKPMRTLAFLLFDHIAGLDTLFYTLHAGGVLVLVDERSPQQVCDAIAQWQVEILPASPSFLKLLCLSSVAETADLRSLRIITFGSEPMDGPTLGRVSALFPNVRLSQKYGASEFGAPSVETRSDNGLWIRFHGAAAKVENDILWVKAPGTMLGYLNADSPPMHDGWLCTGDRVELNGGWMRILGRDSDLINVGGEKVFPSEVEAVISELDAVAEVTVSGEKHPLMGQVVSAMVRPREKMDDTSALRSLVRKHCMKRLTRYKVPTKINFTNAALFNDRQKRAKSTVPDIIQP
ncbi:MAG: fatty acid--CoA ligase family protein [Sphingomonadaceae bacterium]